MSVDSSTLTVSRYVHCGVIRKVFGRLEQAFYFDNLTTLIALIEECISLSFASFKLTRSVKLIEIAGQLCKGAGWRLLHRFQRRSGASNLTLYSLKRIVMLLRDEVARLTANFPPEHVTFDGKIANLRQCTDSIVSVGCFAVWRDPQSA